jgi:hypothetical protein
VERTVGIRQRGGDGGAFELLHKEYKDRAPREVPGLGANMARKRDFGRV